ncbi:MAG: hypothetical protein NZM18_05790 [Thermoflexales bacterium]|nr:hypothetical protein [Thermoflexales bacterium]MDW8350914.1 hypothetical protein [Anaerolineae bacterium]
MKKVRTPSQIKADAAARARALFVAAIAAVVGVIMLLLSSTFLALHCLIAAAIALAGGIAAARAAIPFEPQSFRRAGTLGGIYAALAYALPFMVYNFVRYLGVNDQTAAERAAELTPDQIAMMEQFNIVVGAEFFRGQDVSYIFGYLLFALLFGWVLGIIGGALAKRQMS